MTCAFLQAAMVCVPIPPKSVLMEQPTAAASSLISRLSDHGRSKVIANIIIKLCREYFINFSTVSYLFTVCTY